MIRVTASLAAALLSAGPTSAEARLGTDAWPKEAVVGLQSVWLQPFSVVHGDVAAVYARPTAPASDDPEILVGDSARVEGSVTAAGVRLGNGSAVTGEINARRLECAAGTRCEHRALPALPLPIVVPGYPRFGPGARDVALASARNLVLPPGAYGAVLLRPGGSEGVTVLTLRGGTYEMGSLDMGARSRVECSASCEIHIEGHLRAAEDSSLGAAAQGSLAARDVQVFVGGLDAPQREARAASPAAAIGDRSTVDARVYAPNGTLLLGRGARAQGRLVARDVVVSSGASISGDSSVRSEDELAVERGDPLSREASFVQAADGQVRGFRLSPGVSLGAGEMFLRYAKSLGLGADDDMIESGLRTDAAGRTHRRFRQRHRGVPVVGAEVVVQEDGGRVLSIVGRVAAYLDVAVTPALTESEALARALDALRAERYAWEVPAMPGDDRRPPRGQLAIVSADSTMAPASFRLVYRFDVATAVPFGDETVDIDARSGEVVSRFSNIVFAAVPGQGDTLYGGKQPFLVESFAGMNGATQFRLRVPAGPDLPEIATLLIAEPNEPEADFVDDDGDFATWPAADLKGAKNLGPMIHGVSVHWAMQRVLAYFRAEPFAWKGFDGVGAKTAFALFASEGVAKDLEWPLGPFYHRGIAAICFPLSQKSKDYVDLFTVAHETGHAVQTHATPDLEHEGETGALMEAFGDIVGHLVLLREKGATPWTLSVPPRTIHYKDDLGDGSCGGGGALCPGEQCDAATNQCSQTLPGKSDGRDVANPKETKNPDTYLGEYFLPKSDDCSSAERPCHKNSTVVGHWFYVLMNGEAGTNDPRPESPQGDVYDVKGVGLEKAEKVVARTFKYKFTSLAGFKDLRAASVDAAIDLFGPESPEVAAVTDAWYAVGVGAKYSPRTYSPDGVSGVEPWPALPRWSVLPGEFDWQLQVSTDPSFGADLKTLQATQSVVQAGIVSMAAKVNLRPDTKYFWRVRAKSAPVVAGPSLPEGPTPHLATPVPWIAPSNKKRVPPSPSGGRSVDVPAVLPLPPDASWGAWGASQEFWTAPKIPKALAPVPTIVPVPWGETPPPVAPAIVHPWNAKFAWEAVPGAEEYRLTVSQSALHGCSKTKITLPGQHTVVEFVAGGAPPKTPVNHEVALKSGKSYRWWLQVLGPEGIPGGCAWGGNPIAFKTDTPKVVLLSPPDGEHVSPFEVVLGWQGVPGAAGYLLQLAEGTPSFTGGDEVAGTSSTVQVTKEGTFHWRVQAKGPLPGDLGLASEPRSFVADLTLTKPQPLYPQKEEWKPHQSEATLFKWTHVPGASSYALTVFQRNADGSAGQQAAQATAGFTSCDQYSPGACISLPGVSSVKEGYCWKVAAIGPGGLAGADSDVSCYRIGAARPTLLSPSPGATGVDFAPTTFTWTSSYSPGGYKLYLHKSAGSCGLAGAEQVIPLGPTNQHAAQLAANQQYCVGLIGLNPDGSHGPHAIAFFWTKAAQPSCKVLGPGSIGWLAPPSNAIVTRPVMLRWKVKDASIVDYRVEVWVLDLGGGPVTVLHDATVSAASITAGGEAQFTLPIWIASSVGELIYAGVHARTGSSCAFAAVGGVSNLVIH